MRKCTVAGCLPRVDLATCIDPPEWRIHKPGSASTVADIHMNTHLFHQKELFAFTPRDWVPTPLRFPCFITDGEPIIMEDVGAQHGPGAGVKA